MKSHYDNLVKNLSAATFAPEIIQDLNNRLKTLRAEIEALETAEPPEEYSTNTILEWLKAIKAAPDRRAVHLLVDRIEVSSDKEKTDVNVISTLTSVGELVAAIRYGEIRSDTALRAEQGYFSANALIRAGGAGALPNGRFAPALIRSDATKKQPP